MIAVTRAFDAPPADIGAAAAELRGADGGSIADAILEQDLWSPDRRVLTLLLDPVRVKSGLIPHETAGRALAAGRDVTLVLAGARLNWRVAPDGCSVPDPSRWLIAAPGAGARDPLVVMLPGPLDIHSRDLIAVADAARARPPGTARLRAGEIEWAFKPEAPWTRGAFRLITHPALESPCGDRVRAPFERHGAR